jgi:hypothetical protein
MNASAVIGQPDFVTNNDGVTQTQFEDPYTPYADPTNGRLYVSDAYNNRILIFDTIHITTTSLAGGTAGQGYSDTVDTAGGQGTLSLVVTAGALPPGLLLSSGGAITGTPTTAGTYNFTVTATDDNGTAGALTWARALAITRRLQPLHPRPHPAPLRTPLPRPSPKPQPSRRWYSMTRPATAPVKALPKRWAPAMK